MGKKTGIFYHKLALMTNNLSPVEPTPPEPLPEPKLATPPPRSKLEIARQKAERANAFLQKLEAQARSKVAGENRKLDIRRKVLLGAYLLGKIQKDDDMKAQILAEMDKYLVRDAERALFDLPPLPRKPATPELTPHPLLTPPAPFTQGGGETAVLIKQFRAVID